MNGRHRALRATGAAAAIAAAVALAGCAAATSGAHPTTDASPRAASRPPAAPTCAGILPPTTVKTLTEQGWTVRRDPFFVGDTRLAGGIQCTWGDAAHPSDDVQMYGWAPSTRAQAASAEKELAATGWRKLTYNNDTCFTAAGDMIVNPDSDGFGMTYCFGDGHVTVADTRQGILLVQWPSASGSR